MRRILVLLMLLALAACGDDGMACSKTVSPTSGRLGCAGKLDHLSGSSTLSFDLKDVAAGNSIQVKFTVAVKTGAVTVSFRNAAGQLIARDASGNEPLILEETVVVDSDDMARISLSSTHGISQEVAYTAEFTR